jgi:ribonuclease BN (tRNA processing enzyme)
MLQPFAYTGDTAWTDSVAEAAAGADLLIAEAYYRDKNVPYHLRLADLEAHRDQLTARRIILTHMSADMLSSEPGPPLRARVGRADHHSLDLQHHKSHARWRDDDHGATAARPGGGFHDHGSEAALFASYDP